MKFADQFSNIIFLLFVGGIPLYGWIKKIKVYEVFVEGAKSGFEIAISLIPYLLPIIIGVGMFRASGGFDLIARAMSPVLSALHFPVELLPLALIRPFSGAGAKATFIDLANTHGGSSLIGHTAGVMMGSTETTFYVLAIYFGAAAIRKTRYAVGVGLLSDLVAVTSAVFFAHLFFG